MSGWARSASLVLAGALLVAGCGGGKHFKNEPRPPVPVQLTGVVTDRGVTVSPSRVGGGPIILIVSNQTNEPHTLTLEGNGSTDSVGPVNPLGTGKLQQTVSPGTYTLKAGSTQATANDLPPGTLTVKKQRQSSSSTLELP